VLAGDLVPEEQNRNFGAAAGSAPVFLTAEQPPNDWIKPVPGMPGSFQADGRSSDPRGGEISVSFVPFYRLHRRTYAAYWDLYTPQEWTQKAVAGPPI
jgi:hypothetical protein